MASRIQLRIDRRNATLDTVAYMSPLRALTGTPYLLGDDPSALGRATKVLARADGLRAQAIAAQARLVEQADAALAPFNSALRSEQVAESNQIEGYEWTGAQVRELVSQYRLELASPSKRFLEAVQGDGHTYQVIGLYAAHQLADQLAQTDGPMREIDVRQLHAVVTGNASFAGRYKTIENKISGTSHRTAGPWEVAQAMADLCGWWSTSDANPVLEAAVIHAWLAHIHPFEDGNGRICRILANYSLVKAGFPPLILRSESDRAQYYDALATSDEGDILPLIELFVQTISRTVKLMKTPNYIQSVIDDRLLSDDLVRYDVWRASVDMFRSALENEIHQAGGSSAYQGIPEIGSFSLLNHYDADGNCWFVKFGDGESWEILAFFGYASERMRQLVEDGPFPSIYLSIKDHSLQAIHPYLPLWNSDYCDLPHEIRLRPGTARPVQLRWAYDLESFTIRDGAAAIVKSLKRALQL